MKENINERLEDPCGVEEIWRYPMKSMAGERIIGGGGPQGVGVAGDRGGARAKQASVCQ
jgi:hypothetical protein